jgi:[acyl-carrier-protein] S-malonyltransferase
MKNGAFLFPGQGVQYRGMGSKLYQESKKFRELFTAASDILGYDLWKTCSEGSAESLTDTAITQPAIFVTSVAFFETYRQELPTPQYMAGHSLGEYTALTCAGAIEFAEALSVVQKRGSLMKKAAAGYSGAMLSVTNIEAGLLQQICSDLTDKQQLVSVSAHNSQNQFVISGHVEAIEKAAIISTTAGATATRLNVSAPFHCELMTVAAEDLAKELNKIKFKEPVCRVLSNVTGTPYNSADEIAEGLTSQMTNPVLWQESMNYLAGKGVDFFVETGPGKVLRNLIRNNSVLKAFSLDDEKDAIMLREEIAGNIGALNTLITRSMGIAVSVKNQNFETDAYNAGVVEPFRAIKKIQQQVEESKLLPGADEIATCVSLFCRILNTKLTDQQEKHGRLKQLFTEAGTLQLLPLYCGMLN